MGNDRYVEAGAKDLRLFLATGEEVARLHPHFVLKDAATGDPVSVPAFQARVFLAPVGSPVAASLGNEGYVHGPETSADGHFLTMEPVAPGTYDATIKVPGWRPARRERMTFPWLGEPPVVRLERGTGLSGTVTDADGAPNPGVRVRVQTQTATTDDKGLYRVSGLVEGHADVAFGGHLVRPKTLPIEVPATGRAHARRAGRALRRPDADLRRLRLLRAARRAPSPPDPARGRPAPRAVRRPPHAAPRRRLLRDRHHLGRPRPRPLPRRPRARRRRAPLPGDRRPRRRDQPGPIHPEGHRADAAAMSAGRRARPRPTAGRLG